MPAPRSQEVFDWIVSRISVNSPSRWLHDWVLDAMHEIGRDLPELERVELVSERIDIIKQMFIREQARAIADGMPVFEVVGEDSEFVRGYGIPLPGDSAEVVQRRLRATLRDPVLAALRRLSSNRFEALWQLLVEKLGGSQFNLKGRSGDEGIDFTAEFTVYELSALTGHIAAEWLQATQERSIVNVIGQAKHWPERTVKPENLRELLGTIALHAPNVAAGERKCVIGMLVTTGRFSSNADSHARRTGLILLDGEWVVSAIINFGFGVTDTLGSSSFDETRFVALIEGAVDAEPLSH